MISRKIRSWWYGWQLQIALKHENFQRANHLLQNLKSLNLKLSSLAKLYQDKLQAEHLASHYQQKTEFFVIRFFLRSLIST
jgi:hypothetical protein